MTRCSRGNHGGMSAVRSAKSTTDCKRLMTPSCGSHRSMTSSKSNSATWPVLYLIQFSLWMSLQLFLNLVCGIAGMVYSISRIMDAITGKLFYYWLNTTRQSRWSTARKRTCFPVTSPKASGKIGSSGDLDLRPNRSPNIIGAYSRPTVA